MNNVCAPAFAWIEEQRVGKLEGERDEVDTRRRSAPPRSNNRKVFETKKKTNGK